MAHRSNPKTVDSDKVERETENEIETNRFAQWDDAALAQEMNALSVHEREQIYEEIHGIATIINETPELIASSLQQLRQELALIPRRKRNALDRAMFLRPSITTDDNFHLMFLRACRFDPKCAATKMHRYFTNKLELFGDEKLTKTITLDDLDTQQPEILCRGATQFVPVNQRGVIAQYTLVAALDNISEWKSQMRCLWYRLMAVLEDEDVQKRGIVEIVNLRGQWNVSIPDVLGFLVKCSHILNDRPVRLCAFHVLLDEGGPLSFFVGAANKLLSTDLRIRQRFHVGSDLEIRYSLMSFGIRLQDDCFALGKGIFGLEYMSSYLKSRREKDSENLRREADAVTAPENFLCPRQQDVLMGRGRPYQTWPGNVQLTHWVLQHADHYMRATEEGFDKTTIVSYIVGLVERDNGGCFLQRTNVDWERVKDQAARNKVSQLLRAEARSRRQQGNGDQKDLILYGGNGVVLQTSSSSSDAHKRRRLQDEGD